MRFLRTDGSQIGTAGGPDSTKPSDASRDDASRDDAPVESSAPKKAFVDPAQERDALQALKSLEVPPRQTKSLLARVLAEQPAARAEDLVRAVLLRSSA